MQKKIDRRTFVKMAGTVGASVVAGQVLASCRPAATPTPTEVPPTATAVPGAPTPTPAPPTPTPLPYAGETINFLAHPIFEDMLPPLSEFKALTGIEVIYEGLPFPGIRDKTPLELATGSDVYDVMTLADQWFNLTILPTLEPLDDLLATSPPQELDKFSKGLIGLNTLQGKLWGWTNRTGAWILVYRKDLYEEKGLAVPKTFAELRENARALNDPPNIYGFFLQGSPEGWACDDWVNTLYSFGGQILSDDYKECLLDSPEAMAATKYWVEWATEGLLPPGTATHDYSDQITSLQQGLVAQAITYSPYVVPIEDPEESKTAGKWGYDVVPVWEKSGLDHSRTHLSGWMCVIPRASKHKEAAWEWIKWQTDPENDLYMALRGNGPMRDSTFEHPDFIAVNPAGPVIAEAMAYGLPPIPPVDKRVEIGLMIAAELSSVLTGEKDYKDALLGLKEDITALL